MDARLRELISLGASVSAHCFPCFDYHLQQARKLGIGEEEIRESIRAGFMVMNGAGDKMCEKIKQTFPQISLTENETCSSGRTIGAVHFAPMIRF